MTQEIINLRGYKYHIDICLIGAPPGGEQFRYALHLASETRLRRIIADLEMRPDGQQARIRKLQARLASLVRMNAALTKAGMA